LPTKLKNHSILNVINLTKPNTINNSLDVAKLISKPIPYIWKQNRMNHALILLNV